jgi:hypothetical protein
MADKSLRISSAYALLYILKYQTELINYEAIIIKYYGMCVHILVLIIRKASLSFLCAVLYSHLHPPSTCHIFPRYFLNDRIFGEKKFENKMYVLIFSENLSESFPILVRIQRNIVIRVRRSSI